MKSKTILALSLASNAVLLSAVGYIAVLDPSPPDSPPCVFYVTNALASVTEQVVSPASASASNETTVAGTKQ